MWQNVMDGNRSPGMRAWFDSIEIRVGLPMCRSQKKSMRDVAYTMPEAQIAIQMSLEEMLKVLWCICRLEMISLPLTWSKNFLLHQPNIGILVSTKWPHIQWTLIWLHWKSISIYWFLSRHQPWSHAEKIENWNYFIHFFQFIEVFVFCLFCGK